MLQEENNFEPQSDILRQLTPDIDFVVICNPNNPTGKLIDKELLTEIIEKCQKFNIKILIDECFMDFVADENAYSMIEKLQSNNNLIILKAFTKTYAMPGLRLATALRQIRICFCACMNAARTGMFPYRRRKQAALPWMKLHMLKRQKNL